MSMRILVTGARGFIGMNLVSALKSHGFCEIYEYDKEEDISLLSKYCKDVEFIFHLAGVNRSDRESEFMEGNSDFTDTLIKNLIEYNNPCTILYTSSAQAVLDNPYGRSKKAAEDILFAYSKAVNTKVLIYRLPNVFGKWCRPNYNSVVATFCHNIANDLPIVINEPFKKLTLVYIDDLIEEFMRALEGKESKKGEYCEISTVHTETLEHLADLIRSYEDSRRLLTVPDMSDDFSKKLYNTYLTYLPKQKLSYVLKMNRDTRGSFTELLKHPVIGQLSVNVIKPGITKGNHWHNTKIEKFLVVSGQGIIRLRNIYSDEMIQYKVDASMLEVIEIPPGFTHNISNCSDTDLVAVIWANECFDEKHMDTFYMEV